MSRNSDFSVWPFIIVVIGILTVIQMIAGNNSATTTVTPANTSSPEYRYAKERVKLEGYSDKEAAQAADAIIKFHNAQKAR